MYIHTWFGRIDRYEYISSPPYMGTNTNCEVKITREPGEGSVIKCVYPCWQRKLTSNARLITNVSQCQTIIYHGIRFLLQHSFPLHLQLQHFIFGAKNFYILNSDKLRALTVKARQLKKHCHFTS